MSPRRSSRARTTQPPPIAMQHTNSSGSSSSLPRAERSTRSNNKNNSPRRASTQRSQSLEDRDGSAKSDLPLTRQRQLSRHDDGNDDMLKLGGDGNEEDGDEEEITRCICGQQDYPGLPVTSREAAGKSGVKDEPALNSSGPASDALSEEAGSLFIQCDSCKVWQHGGCVGIMDEATSPDEYFCEECKKHLHRIVTGVNGVKSSQYLPVTNSSPPASSRASSRDNSKRGKDSKSRQNSNALSTKRRSTMNSRDAAYDEEEQIRRAIEESRDDNKTSPEENVTRRGKRSRSDSEANKQAAKRPRTSSPSPSSLSKQSNSVSQPDSDDETKSKASAGNSKKPRGAAARNQKETREIEKEQEKERPDTTGRRKGNRRRDGMCPASPVLAEGATRADIISGNSAPSEEPSPTKAASKTSAPAQATPDPSAAVQEPTSNPKPPARKTGRPPARRGRLGRNQYTRDRDQANGNGDANSINATSPRRGQSHDTGVGDSPNGGHANGVNGGESGKPSKPRYMNPHRTTMNEMRRRVAAILEFISRLQVEMAVSGENTSTPGDAASTSNNSGNGGNSNDVEAATALVKGVEAQLGTFMQSNGARAGTSTTSNDGTNGAANGETPEPPKEKDFKDLTSVEMMDVLTRNLLKWQQEYGKYGEK
ncbi:hypothetical protein FQN54_005470 [Arachnomyces sp. PD_36]|nr:hypothetical protein FQN54_005470 [Arachnomyces sp. PD_36]